jgi:hypothetical protein
MAQEVASVTKTVTEGYAELANPLYQRDIEDIVPGEGAVVQRGVQKVQTTHFSALAWVCLKEASQCCSCGACVHAQRGA